MFWLMKRLPTLPVVDSHCSDQDGQSDDDPHKQAAVESWEGEGNVGGLIDYKLVIINRTEVNYLCNHIQEVGLTWLTPVEVEGIVCGHVVEVPTLLYHS